MKYLIPFLLITRTILADVYHVDASHGDDTSPGSADAPWRSLQHAADRVQPGDTIRVRAGTYTGLYLETSGTTTQPITITAAPGTVITKPNPTTKRDGINLELVSHVTIEGFTIRDMPRAGIRAVGIAKRHGTSIVLRDNACINNGTWGIFAAFIDDLLIEGNTCNDSRNQHGIYVSNSGDRPVVRNNVMRGNENCGLHMNGDVNMGGDGVITGALIEGNLAADNGATGGSSINCDGVQDSVIRHNLVKDAHASGISLYRIDGGAASTGNLVHGNVVIVARDGRSAINVQDASVRNRVIGNVLVVKNPERAIIDVSRDSRRGFEARGNHEGR